MSSFSQNEKKKTKTHGKISHLERRFLAFTLVIAMCLTSMGTHFFGLLPSLGIESVTANAETADSLVDGQKIYDSGTIVLDAYYNGSDKSVDNLHQEAWKTDSAATSCTDYKTVDSKPLTLAGTTDINSNADDGYIGCLAEWTGMDLDKAHQTPDFGAPAPGKGNTGEIFYYIAEGEVIWLNSESYKIDWRIKVWDKVKADAASLVLPTTQATIEAEWNAGTTIEDTWVKSGNIFNSMAPVWSSGNTHYDDWKDADKFLDYGVFAEFYSDAKAVTPHTLSSVWRSKYVTGTQPATPNFGIDTNSDDVSDRNWDDEQLFDVDTDSNTVPFFLGRTGTYQNYQDGDIINIYGYLDELLFHDGYFSTVAPVYYLSSSTPATKNTFVISNLQGAGNTAYRIYQLRINNNFKEDSADVTVDVKVSPSAFLDDAVINGFTGAHTTQFNGKHISEIIGHVGTDGKNDVFVRLSYDCTDDVQRGVGGVLSVPFAHTNTVTVATVATDKKTGMQTGTIGTTETITDKVTMDDLVPNHDYEYVITVKNLTDDSEIKTFTHNFTATAAHQVETIDVAIDSSALAGKTIGLSGKLTDKDHASGSDVVVATHNGDYSVDDQKIYYPGISTVLAETSTGNKTIVINSVNVSLTDNITFQNLVNGASYKYITKLMYNDGTPVTSASDYTGNFVAGSTSEAKTSTFTFNATGLEGKTVVAYNYLYYVNGGTDYLVASEEDPTNMSQTVGFNPSGTPSMTTVATDSANNTHTMSMATDAKIKDVVSMTNLITGMNYKLVTEVWDADANSQIAAITPVETTFTATALNMDKEVFVDIDTTQYVGKKLVIYETLYSGSTKVCEHCNIADTAQTVTVPGNPTISTEAKSSTDTKTIPYSTSAIIIDKVSYEDVVKGTEYTLKTTVRYTDGTDTGITVADTKFTPSDTTGSVNVNISFNSTSFRGKDLVVYEELYIGTVKVAEHCDKTDAKQTVKVDSPTMSLVTSATYEDGTRVVPYTDTSATVTDAATYTGLDTTVNYTMTTTVVYKSSGSAVTGIDEVITTFKPSSENGTVSVDVTFDASKYQGQTFVIYEVIKDNTNKVILEHKDLNDAAQTVRITQPTPPPSNPWISTTAVDSVTKTHKMSIDKNAKIEDTVSYYDVTAGATYILHATVYDKETGNLMADVKADKTFVPTSTNGTVVVTIPIDTTKYEGKSFVVFERLCLTTVDTSILDNLINNPGSPSLSGWALNAETELKKYGTIHSSVSDALWHLQHGSTTQSYIDIVVTALQNAKSSAGTTEVEVASHTSLTDASQTVTVPFKPVLDTVATDMTTGTHTLTIVDGAKVVEKVSYSNVTIGGNYKLKTTVYDVTDGKLVEGFTAIETAFVPSSTTGDVTINIDAAKLIGLNGHKLVIYEELYIDNVLVAEHKDNADADQTINVPKPTLATKAFLFSDTAKNKKDIPVGSDVIVGDELTFTDLTPNQSYTIETWAVEKGTGKVITTVGKTTFAPTTASGTTTVQLHIDTRSYVGKEIVIYERILLGTKVVVEHVDINDAAQTVKVVTPSIETVATSNSSGAKVLNYSASEKIKDTITFTNFTVGEKYKIQTYVYIKETGAQASDIAVVSSEFVATENGSISVLIPVDATKHVGQTLVVYEYIYDSNNTLIAQHADINDVKQAVTVSKISTVLTGADLKSKTLDMNLTAGKAIDTITYSGLEPGQTYVLTGVLVDYETLTGTKPTETTTVTTNTTSEDTVDVSGGASATPTSAPAATRTIPADGTIATATIEFTPSAASGSVQQTFSVDTTGLYGHHLVAYETLTLKSTGAALGQHKDLNDANQTVIVKTPAIVQTGLNDVVTPFFIVSLLLFLAFLGYGAFTLISMKKKATKVVVRK